MKEKTIRQMINNNNYLEVCVAFFKTKMLGHKKLKKIIT